MSTNRKVIGIMIVVIGCIGAWSSGMMIITFPMINEIRELPQPDGFLGEINKAQLDTIDNLPTWYKNAVPARGIFLLVTSIAYGVSGILILTNVRAATRVFLVVAVVAVLRRLVELGLAFGVGGWVFLSQLSGAIPAIIIHGALATATYVTRPRSAV